MSSADVTDAARAPGAPAGLFVYGTLAHPAILRRVLGLAPDEPLAVEAYPALVAGHAVHHVRGEDYPALRPVSHPQAGVEPQAHPACFARGLFLLGLAPDQIRLLDTFEGDEYTRDIVQVILPDGLAPVPPAASPSTTHPASSEPPAASASASVSASASASASGNLSGPEPAATITANATGTLLDTFRLLDVAASALSVAPDSVDDPELTRPAQVYLWSAGDDKLIPHNPKMQQYGAWRLETFVEHKAQDWTTPLSEDHAQFRSVDRLRLGLPPEDASHTPGAPVHPSLLEEDDPWSSPDDPSSIPAPFRMAAAAEAGIPEDDPWGAPRPFSPVAATSSLTAAVAAAKIQAADPRPASQATPAERSSSLLADPAHSVLPDEDLESHAGWGDGAAEPDEPQNEAEGEKFVDPDEDHRFSRLGHSVRHHWVFHEGYTNLNNGSYGAPPKEVRQLYRTIQEEADANPDLFHRVTFAQYLRKFYERVAPYLHCSPHELVIMPNASTGLNVVLRDYPWRRGDAVVTLSIGYGSAERTIRYVQDTLTPRLGGPEASDAGDDKAEVPHLATVPITLPMSHDAILSQVEQVLDEIVAKGLAPRLMVVDAISSKPAVRLPWERIVALLRQRQVFSLVDAAHGLGAIPLNIAQAQPDVLITVPSKWCYAPRAAAVMFVAPSTVGTVPISSLPTSHGYVRQSDLQDMTPERRQRAWQAQWDDAGTTDFALLPTSLGGLDFAEMRLGGLARVQAYTTHLARIGGRAAARILQTETLDAGDDDLACIPMTNVRLPLDPKTWDKDWMAPGMVNDFFEKTLWWFKTTIPLFEHSGSLYARFSAQVWLEKSDFEYGARALKEICRRLNAGEVTLPLQED